MEERATRTDKPMKPQVVGWELGKRLANDAIVSPTAAPSRPGGRATSRQNAGQMHSCSGTLATMACGLPYAIAAQVAYPDRQVVRVWAMADSPC